MPKRRADCRAVAFLAFAWAIGWAGLAATGARAEPGSKPLVLRVGIYQNEPKIFFNAAGRADGFFVELLEEIARRENWTLEYVPCVWSDCLRALEKGELDLMPDVAQTAVRAEVMSFNRVPALYGWIQVYRHPRAAIRSPLDLGGRRLAVLKNSVQEHALTNLLFGFGLTAELVPCSSFEEAFRITGQGEADAVLANRFFGERNYTRYGLVRTDIMFYPSPLHFATPLGKHAEVRATLDRYLEAWKQDPASPYYLALHRWLEQGPVFHIPPYVRWVLLVLLGLVPPALAVIWILKWEVARRTREWQIENQRLQKALADLHRYQEQAAHQERLHVLGQMASGIAHDFNNVLTLIAGYADLLQIGLESGVDAERLRKDVQVIAEAVRDGGEIVKRMRAFYAATGEREPRAPLSVNELIQSVLVLAQPRWDTQARARGVRIHIRTMLQEVPPVLGNAAELRQALLNLVVNALDAMPDGGELTVRTFEENGRVGIEVGDTGCGMTPEVLAQCRRPFFTTKGQRGTGLGLPIVVAAVTGHGGQLDIQSAPGQGTRVRISLPALPRAAPALRPAAAEYAIRPLSILAVDDDEHVLAALATLLTREGHRVDANTRPLAALDKALRNGYEVILVDLAMPELSGIQFVEILRTRGCSTPVVLMTGTLETIDETAANLPGVIHFLSKPFSITRLREVFAALGFQA